MSKMNFRLSLRYLSTKKAFSPSHIKSMIRLSSLQVSSILLMMTARSRAEYKSALTSCHPSCRCTGGTGFEDFPQRFYHHRSLERCDLPESKPEIDPFCHSKRTHRIPACSLPFQRPDLLVVFPAWGQSSLSHRVANLPMLVCHISHCFHGLHTDQKNEIVSSAQCRVEKI